MVQKEAARVPSQLRLHKRNYYIAREKAIKDMERKLVRGEKKHTPSGQTLTRHEAVLSFLRIQQSKQQGVTCESMAQIVARCFKRGIYFAHKVVSWEIEWVQNRTIRL